MPPTPPTASSDTAPPTKPLPSLSPALTNVVQRATDRANDGQLIYGPIAALWDEYLQSDEVRKLPVRLRNPLIALCKDISATANRHFDAFIKGTHPPRPLGEGTATNTSQSLYTPPNSTSTSPPTTYAQAASTTACEQPIACRRQPATPRPVRPDTRLFIRLGQNHKARKAGAFAIYLALKGRLGEHSSLLKEVQAVKSGFALCTDSLEELTALERFTGLITDSIGDCTTERQSKWTTYRLDNVPRTVSTLDGPCQVCADGITNAIFEITSQKPIRTVETAQSIHNGLYNTSWFISFESLTHTLIPRTLRMFGVAATASVATFKPKTIQCTKCFQWHNTRSCSRAQRCRICGSNNHSEENHSTRCVSAKPHSCPARCVHCGGPHPADDIHCPLRPTRNGPPKSKTQREVIIKTLKATRTKACAAAKCIRPDRTAIYDIQMSEEAFTPPSLPTTPPWATSAISITPTPATRFLSAAPTNRFTPLLKLA